LRLVSLLPPLLVRENLWLALQHLRSSQRRVFWIDAICVNQEDKSERSHQVGLMETIYTRATKVHVWLGPECENTSEAFDLLEIIWVASGKLKHSE
jgi:hypothetical protein